MDSECTHLCCFLVVFDDHVASLDLHDWSERRRLRRAKEEAGIELGLKG